MSTQTLGFLGTSQKPTSAMAAQRRFLQQHGEMAEQLLAIGVCLLPVARDGEGSVSLGSQSAFALLDIFGLYRTMLLRSPQDIPVPIPSSSPVSRELLRKLRRRYSAAAFALRATRIGQILVEGHALKVGGEQRALWSCLAVETLKLPLKAVMHWTTDFGFFVDDETIALVGQQEVVAQQHGQQFGSPQPLPMKKQWRGIRPRTSRSTPWVLFAELLFHCRPIVQLGLMIWLTKKKRDVEGSSDDTGTSELVEKQRQFKRQRWVVWALSLLMDILATSWLSAARLRPEWTYAGALERAEVRRRMKLLPWAFARSPFFESVLERPAKAADRLISSVPILNVFNMLEVFLAFRHFYSYTSAT